MIVPRIHNREQKLIRVNTSRGQTFVIIVSAIKVRAECRVYICSLFLFTSLMDGSRYATRGSGTMAFSRIMTSRYDSKACVYAANHF